MPDSFRSNEIRLSSGLKEENMKYKFKMYDMDLGEFKVIPRASVVDAIHYAWNYEYETWDRETDEPILCPFDSNDVNSGLLEPYGLRLIDDEGYRRLQNIETGEIYKASWE